MVLRSSGAHSSIELLAEACEHLVERQGAAVVEVVDDVRITDLPRLEQNREKALKPLIWRSLVLRGT